MVRNRRFLNWILAGRLVASLPVPAFCAAVDRQVATRRYPGPISTGCHFPETQLIGTNPKPGPQVSHLQRLAAESRPALRFPRHSDYARRMLAEAMRLVRPNRGKESSLAPLTPPCSQTDCVSECPSQNAVETHILPNEALVRNVNRLGLLVRLLLLLLPTTGEEAA